MEYVVAIARAGSLSAAALQLNVSQPSLSVALMQVESRLGQRLFFRRKGAPMHVTPFGREYLTEAEALLAIARRLDDPTVAPQSAKIVITFGCFVDLAPRLLVPLLSRLRSAMPDIELRWRVADFETLAREMIEGRIDLSLTYDLGLDASFERIELGLAIPHAFLAANHPVARTTAVSLQRLAREPLIVFEEGLSIRHVLGLFRQTGVAAKVAHRVTSLELMRSLAANGEGVGISYTTPPGEISYDGVPVAAVPIEDAIAQESIILAHLAIKPASVHLSEVRACITTAWVELVSKREVI